MQIIKRLLLVVLLFTLLLLFFTQTKIGTRTIKDYNIAGLDVAVVSDLSNSTKVAVKKINSFSIIESIGEGKPKFYSYDLIPQCNNRNKNNSVTKTVYFSLRTIINSSYQTKRL